MKIALVVGINQYQYGSPLFGCVNDAYSVKAILERNGNGSVNFDCKLMTASSSSDSISRATLKDNIEKLFKTEAQIAMLYFAGHGHIEATGGYLLASDSRRGDEGVSLSEILLMANRPGPYIEPFACGPRKGWCVRGNQADEYIPTWETYSNHSQTNATGCYTRT